MIAIRLNALTAVTRLSVLLKKLFLFSSLNCCFSLSLSRSRTLSLSLSFSSTAAGSAVGSPGSVLFRTASPGTLGDFWLLKRHHAESDTNLHPLERSYSITHRVTPSSAESGAGPANWKLPFWRRASQ